MRSRSGLSLLVCILCFGVFILIRVLSVQPDIRSVKVATSDALGYYMYLPGTFIYHDLKELKWYPKIDSIYRPTSSFYQAGKFKNGNYVFKYLSGTAIVYSPFFFAAHYLAPHFGYPQDGFSFPYQLAICIASLIYAFLALLVLRKVLLYYFDDKVTAITILLVALATNLPQYVSVDAGMTHSFLFALYSFQLLVTILWYREPKAHWAFVIGLLIGLAAITRPTDAVMLLIPLLWNEPDKSSSKAKWRLVGEHKLHILIAGLGLFIGVLPQLVYWKYVTGGWVYDVGSKWVFLDPFWRVLFGWTNGWLIYTPVVIFFFVGLFLMKGRPFKRSVIVFFIINTWIIISWFDWRYGATYSCRALVQSYPLLALSFASAVAWFLQSRWRYAFFLLSIYLLSVNLFQIYQYDKGIIYFKEMNRLYYQAVYLNAHPTPIDISLLDTDERLHHEENYQKRRLYILRDSTLFFHPGVHELASIALSDYCRNAQRDYWLRVDLNGSDTEGLWDTYLNGTLTMPDTTRTSKIRFFNILNEHQKQTRVSFYQHIVPPFTKGTFQLSLSNSGDHKIKVDSLAIHLFSRESQ